MRRATMTATATAGALLLVLGVTACGSDDDDSASTTTADGAGGQPAGLDAFCGAIVEFNGAVLEVDLDDTSSEEDVKATGAELAELWAPIGDNAPDDLADTAQELGSAIDQLAAGSPESFNSDATFETYSTFVGSAAEACAFEEVAVSGVDYAFEGVPASLAPGTYSFSFANGSAAEEHEMIIIKRKDGVDLTFEEIAELPEEETEDKVEFIGAAFAPPGGESGTLAELSPGDYAMFCFIPVGGGEEGAPHFTQGMLQEFTVEE